MSDRVTASVVIVGNEILSGRTKDANLAYLAVNLVELGISLREVRVVADDQRAIVDAVNACRAAYDYVFTTGGIGPTHDDITCAAIAVAFGVPVIRHPEAEQVLRGFYEERGIEVTDARMKMADVPEGARLVDNGVSKAPGFWIENVIVMAGIPRVMQAMFEAVKGDLRRGPVVGSRSLSCAIAEGTIAAGLQDLQDTYPDLEIGSYPFFNNGRPGTTLVVRGTDKVRLNEAAERINGLIRSLGGEALPDRLD